MCVWIRRCTVIAENHRCINDDDLAQCSWPTHTQRINGRSDFITFRVNDLDKVFHPHLMKEAMHRYAIYIYSYVVAFIHKSAGTESISQARFKESRLVP